MFNGDHPQVVAVLHRAAVAAQQWQQPRVGSEHLLTALTESGGPLAVLLARHGATGRAVELAVRVAAPLGAGAAADRQLLGMLGVDLDSLVGYSGQATLGQPMGRQPLFPLGADRARKRCAHLKPAWGTDTQAVYEASLRLALGRQEHQHRPEHLALALLALDPGIAWVLEQIGVNRPALLRDLEQAFPAPQRNRLAVGTRWQSRRYRHRGIVRRPSTAFPWVVCGNSGDGPALGGLRSCGAVPQRKHRPLVPGLASAVRSAGANAPVRSGRSFINHPHQL